MSEAALPFGRALSGLSTPPDMTDMGAPLTTGAHWDANDVMLVMQQAHCLRAAAMRALRMYEGDILKLSWILSG